MDKKPKPINIDAIDLDQMKKKTSDLPSLLEYAHSVGGFSITPSKQGVIKGSALKAMGEQTQMQLDQIFEQMQLLAKQAKELKDRADVSEQIYTAHMSFKPVIGNCYYLYTKKDDSKILSLVSPDDWGSTMPFKQFEAKVKLLADHTWQVIKE